MKQIQLHLLLFVLILIRSATGGTLASAQESITLEQAVNTALNQHPALKSSALSVEIADEQLTADKSALIPDVSSEISLQRNLIIPSTPVPLNEITGQGDPTELSYVKFGTDWQSNLGLLLRYDLFNPTRKQQILAGEESRKLAELDHDAREAQVKIEVIKAYAELVLASEQLKYAKEDTLYNSLQLLDARERFNEGRLKANDLNEANIRLSRSVIHFDQARSVYDQARIELAYRMGLAPDQGTLPQAADSLETLLHHFQGTDLPGTVPENTNGFMRLQTQALHDSLQLQNTRLMLLPTLSLNAGYGTNFYQNELQPFNTDNWYGNSFVALSLNIPLTREITTHHHISRAKLELDQRVADLQDFKNRREADLQKYMRELQQYEKELEQRASETALTDKNLAFTREEYEAGRVLASELHQAKLSRENARVSYLQAAYNYIVTSLQLKDLMEVR